MVVVNVEITHRIPIVGAQNTAELLPHFTPLHADDFIELIWERDEEAFLRRVQTRHLSNRRRSRTATGPLKCKHYTNRDVVRQVVEKLKDRKEFDEHLVVYIGAPAVPELVLLLVSDDLEA